MRSCAEWDAREVRHQIEKGEVTKIRGRPRGSACLRSTQNIILKIGNNFFTYQYISYLWEWQNERHFSYHLRHAAVLPADEPRRDTAAAKANSKQDPTAEFHALKRFIGEGHGLL